MSFKVPDWFRYEMREKWERLTERFLAARTWLNRQNPKIIIGIAIVSTLVLLIVVIKLLIPDKLPEPQEYEKAWFYDLNTGKLFAARKDLISPIDAPSGPLPNGELAGVKAHVLTYAHEPNESQIFIGFLETTDPNAEKDSSGSVKPRVGRPKRWGYGKLIRRVEDQYWFPGDSRAGRAILEQSFRPNENGEPPAYYRPK